MGKAHQNYLNSLDALAESAAEDIETLFARDSLSMQELVRERSQAASQLANDYYDVNRELWKEYAGVDMPDFDHRNPVPAERTLWQVQGGFSKSDYNGLTYTQVMNGQSRAGARIDDLWPPMSNLDDVQQFIADMIRASARLTTQRNIRMDPTKPRWARVPRGEKTCAFCLMLASRGFAYLSGETAGLSHHYHNCCDCQIVASWGKHHLSGYDPERYMQMWQAASQGEGDYREALKRMRHMYPEQLKDGQVRARRRASWQLEKRLLSMKGQASISKKGWDARQKKLGIPISHDVLEMHEIVFLERFSSLGNHYQWIPKDRNGKPTNDFYWEEQAADFELKSMSTLKYRSVADRIKRATSKASSQQVVKDSFIIDCGDADIPDKLLRQLARYNQGHEIKIQRLFILNQGKITEINLNK